MTWPCLLIGHALKLFESPDDQVLICMRCAKPFRVFDAMLKPQPVQAPAEPEPDIKRPQEPAPWPMARQKPSV